MQGKVEYEKILAISDNIKSILRRMESTFESINKAGNEIATNWQSEASDQVYESFKKMIPDFDAIKQLINSQADFLVTTIETEYKPADINVAGSSDEIGEPMTATRAATLSSGGTIASPTEPLTSKKTLDDVASEVIRGKWGNGEERIKNLVDAGYDYVSVQQIVEQQLKDLK